MLGMYYLWQSIQVVMFLPGSDRGASLSTDNGANWTQINNGIGGGVYSLAINSSDYVFAGTYLGGVYLTTNNGGNWTQINTGLTYH